MIAADDDQRTAVVSQRGMARALGYGSNATGRQIHIIAQNPAVAPILGRETLEKFSKPLVFMGPSPGRHIPPFVVHGYDVTLLIDLCQAIIAADRTTPFVRRGMVEQAHIIVGASAKTGIKSLVYALAGYDVSKQEIIDAFKTYVQEEAREYEKLFPRELYEEWYRLYKLEPREKGRPGKFQHLTVGRACPGWATSRPSGSWRPSVRWRGASWD